LLVPRCFWRSAIDRRNYGFIDLPGLFRATERLLEYPLVDRDPVACAGPTTMSRPSSRARSSTR
jgi:hypothetical protein